MYRLIGVKDSISEQNYSEKKNFFTLLLSPTDLANINISGSHRCPSQCRRVGKWGGGTVCPCPKK